MARGLQANFKKVDGIEMRFSFAFDILPIFAAVFITYFFRLFPSERQKIVDDQRAASYRLRDH